MRGLPRRTREPARRGPALLDDRPACEVATSRAPRLLAVGIGWAAADPGGLNRYVTDLHVALTDLGVQIVTVVVGSSSRAPTGMQLVRARSLPGRLVGLWRATQRVMVADVLVSHFAPHALLPVLLGRWSRTPLVAHFHGPWAQESAFSGERRARVRAKYLLERCLYTRADALVVLSSDFKDLLVDHYGVDPDRVHVVEPGVDVQRFGPLSDDERAAVRLELGVDPARQLILVPRRLVARMGHEVLFEAWQRAAPAARLVVVGAGPLEQSLRLVAQDLPDVHVVGALAEDALVRAYQAADLVIVPSLALEGFGLVVLEALACGTPVLASRLGGMGQLLPRLAEGLVVPPGDAPALAEALTRALDGGLPNRETCAAFAMDHAWPKAARELVALYSQVASRPRRPLSRAAAWRPHRRR